MHCTPLSRAARRLLAVAAVAVAAGCAQQPTQPDGPSEVDAGIVSVTYADPSGFTDAGAGGRAETNAQRREWVTLLCEHVAERAAPLLASGERLEVQLLDVRRAGRFDARPGSAAGGARVVSDGAPPYIELEFRRVGANGEIVQMGRRTLDASDFMQRARRYPNDSLRYEKGLLDGWVAQEFGTAR